MPATTTPTQALTHSQGEGGTVMIGALSIGRLGSWEVIYSPTTGMPTLKGEGSFLRYFHQGIGSQVVALLTPSPLPYRIGRKRPPAPRPFTLTGELVRLTATGITIASGAIAWGSARPG